MFPSCLEVLCLLRHLSVQNFAIVDKAELEFGPGFNVLTGETGAGKSLLVDALYFLLGDRLDPGILRTGEEKASAEALFQVAPDSIALRRLADWGFEALGGEILLKREFNRTSGKTRSTINGSLATAAMVAELSDLLVDLHGQHEHQAIFNVGRHRKLVDTYGKHVGDLQKTAEAHASLAGLLDEKKRLGGDAREAERRRDLLAFQIQELEEAGLESLDEETILDEYQAAKHAGKIAGFLGEAQAALDEDGGGGATRQIGSALARVSDAAKLDPGLSALADQAKQAQEILNQLSYDLARRLDAQNATEAKFQALSDRVDLIHKLKKKYGDSIPDIRAYLVNIQSEWKTLEHREERLGALNGEIKAAAERYSDTALSLHAKRVKTGARLAGAVKGLLADLGLPDARMEVAVDAQADPESPALEKKERRALSALGWDKVEFQFSANPGEPLRPLAKVASGGESSRVMLALKAVLADSDEVSTLVFDEIDTGVGARTAPAVGRVMENLSAEKQVLCISHLAPLACLGRTHYRVRKEKRGGKTFTLVEKMEGADRVEELAKMLGGEVVTDASLTHAREMLKPRGLA